MSFLKKFGITFGSNKNKLLPGGVTALNPIENSYFSPTDSSAYKTLATFDINIESPKYEGAIPEASIKFYPYK